MLEKGRNIGVRFRTKDSEVGSGHPGREVERESGVGVDEGSRERRSWSDGTRFEELDEHRGCDICTSGIRNPGLSFEKILLAREGWLDSR